MIISTTTPTFWGSTNHINKVWKSSGDSHLALIKYSKWSPTGTQVLLYLNDNLTNEHDRKQIPFIISYLLSGTWVLIKLISHPVNFEFIDILYYIILPYPNINKHQNAQCMFEPLWKKYHRRTQVGNRTTTSWLLDRRHTTYHCLVIRGGILNTLLSQR